MVLFIGSLILAVVALTLVTKFQLGAAEASEYYRANYNAEAIGTILSSFSTEEGDIETVYLLPKAKCSLDIDSDSVKIKIYAQEIETGVRTIKLGEEEATYDFINMGNIIIKEFHTECSEKEKVVLKIQKVGNEISVMI